MSDETEYEPPGYWEEFERMAAILGADQEPVNYALEDEVLAAMSGAAPVDYIQEDVVE